jgi:hypothetical protein
MGVRTEEDVAAQRALTFFFLHVMKTGGTTFVQHLEHNFAATEIYPRAERGPGRRREYSMIDDLRQVAATRPGSVRMYSGHFPYVASVIVGADVTLTVLRDPIDRTVSMLRHVKRFTEEHQDAPLEAIYEDAWVFPLYIHNYQAKLFAMTLDDKLESHLDVLDIDAERLAIAKENLEQVDVVGLTEEYPEFVRAVHDRFGWEVRTVSDLNVSDVVDRDVSPAFRRRIAADNAADMEFYEHARSLSERRKG